MTTSTFKDNRATEQAIYQDLIGSMVKAGFTAFLPFSARDNVDPHDGLLGFYISSPAVVILVSVPIIDHHHPGLIFYSHVSVNFQGPADLDLAQLDTTAPGLRLIDAWPRSLSDMPVSHRLRFDQPAQLSLEQWTAAISRVVQQVRQRCDLSDRLHCLEGSSLITLDEDGDLAPAGWAVEGIRRLACPVHGAINLVGADLAGKSRYFKSPDCLVCEVA